MFQKLKDAWTRYLARLAKDNQELFGNETPSCCKVGRNHKKPAAPVQGTKKS